MLYARRSCMPEVDPVLLFVCREGGSEKHLRDIRGILDVSGESLDWPELRRRIDAGELQRAWARVEELPL